MWKLSARLLHPIQHAEQSNEEKPARGSWEMCGTSGVPRSCQTMHRQNRPTGQEPAVENIFFKRQIIRNEVRIKNKNKVGNLEVFRILRALSLSFCDEGLLSSYMVQYLTVPPKTPAKLRLSPSHCQRQKNNKNITCMSSCVRAPSCTYSFIFNVSTTSNEATSAHQRLQTAGEQNITISHPSISLQPYPPYPIYPESLESLESLKPLSQAFQTNMTWCFPHCVKLDDNRSHTYSLCVYDVSVWMFGCGWACMYVFVCVSGNAMQRNWQCNVV